jgi:hypothetical protein
LPSDEALHEGSTFEYRKVTSRLTWFMRRACGG